MAATIVSAAVSLFLVYNVVLGGNKPQQGGNKAQQRASKHQQGSFASTSAAKSSNANAAQDDMAYQSPAGASWWDTSSNDEMSQVRPTMTHALPCEVGPSRLHAVQACEDSCCLGVVRGCCHRTSTLPCFGTYNAAASHPPLQHHVAYVPKLEVPARSQAVQQ